MLLFSFFILRFTVWDGQLLAMSLSGHISACQRTAAGVTVVRSLQKSDVIIAAGDDGNISLYSTHDLKLLQNTPGHDDIISSIAINLPGNEFASVGWDGILNFWSISDFNCPVASTKAHGGNVHHVSYCHHNPSVVVTVGSDGFCRLWDSRQLQSGCSLMINMNQSISCCNFGSGFGVNSTVVGLIDGDVALIDWRAHEILAQRPFHNSRVNSIRSVEDRENNFVSASDDMTSSLSIFDVSSESQPTLTRYVTIVILIIENSVISQNNKSNIFYHLFCILLDLFITFSFILLISFFVCLQGCCL